MSAVDPEIRLSVQRALLGAIHPDVRIVEVRRDEDRITCMAIFDEAFSDDTLDALTTVAAEIAADFPDCDLNEGIGSSTAPFPAANALAGGWLLKR